MKSFFLIPFILTTFLSFAQQKSISQKEFDRQQRKVILQHYKNEIYQSNFRERKYISFKNGNHTNGNYKSVDYASLTAQTDNIAKDESSNIKYERSSLYTLMIADTLNEYYYYTKYVFGNKKLSDKFNDHNIGAYQISGNAGASNQAENIENYLNKNNVAKQLVAKWFNRGSDGSFNMDLVSNRGTYSASDLDIKIAMHTARGKAMLKDAGEESINNTFVAVFDFENITNTRPSLSNTIHANITIKAYLYRLIWDDATASTFYTDYWMDKNNINPSRKVAFDNSNIFKLKYMGNVVTEKNSKVTIREAAKHGMKISKEGFIKPDELGLNQDALAINNTLDACINKLQIKYPDLRTKFPLYSGNPIAAKVGKKEGIKEGDEFEVLERILNEDGSTEYQRVGIIKIDKEEDIWDNTTEGDWFKESSNLEYTIFGGQKNKYQTGMFIRQIN
ncbi:hypothetical protein [Sinomicrobium soli]|uniref:hypothetical protein n=1 Tax=Sinomicrobium sp. N-1-3-6 TaxID=2219864 RepID=UPI000DCC9AF8|nr:hypothetical protein [Sinomicrobium sp. N-1-3-6]RAV29522.1 hypothetical protein DN748_08490 [Sinomicrobium sp. N-1-3-6]